MNILILLVLLHISSIQNMEKTLNFHPEEIMITESNHYTVVTGYNLQCFSRVNQPVLPAKQITYLLPSDAEITGVNVEGYQPVVIGKAECPIPGDPPNPFSSEIRITGICDPKIYQSDQLYPQEFLASYHLGNQSGFKLFSAMVLPLKWDPVSKDIILYQNIKLTISYRQTGDLFFNSPLRDQLHRKLLTVQLDNPEVIDLYAPSVIQGNVDYLIIAPEDFIQTNAIDSLLNLRSSQGLITDTASLERIESNYSGLDTPEKIRSYLIQRFQQDGLSYALLVGDLNLMPPRQIWTCAYDTNGASWPDSSPVDLYFADLDGSWNYNQDNRYGQPDDSLDLYADIFVGRLPVSDSNDLSNAVKKIYIYETDPPGGNWQNTALLCGAILFPDYNYTGEPCCESIAQRLPGNWNLIKLYEPLPYGPAPSGSVDSLNNGVAWVQWCGHGNKSGVYWSYTRMIHCDDIPTLNNAGKLGVHTSISCLTGAFQENRCLAKDMVNFGNGGAIVGTFNTSYGWEGYLAQGEMGPSEFMDIWFAEAVFDSNIVELGPAFYSAKARRVPYWDHNFYNGYDRNLSTILVLTYFGDPAVKFVGSGSGVEEIGVAPPSMQISYNFSNLRLEITTGMPSRLSIFDLTGRKLHQCDFYSQLSQDLSFLGSGRYFLMVSAGNKQYCKEFTVIK